MVKSTTKLSSYRLVEVTEAECFFLNEHLNRHTLPDEEVWILQSHNFDFALVHRLVVSKKTYVLGRFIRTGIKGSDLVMEGEAWELIHEGKVYDLESNTSRPNYSLGAGREKITVTIISRENASRMLSEAGL